MSLSDSDLIQGLKNKDQKMTNAFIKKHVDYIYHLALRTLGNAPEAEEVTNDVFMKAIAKIDQLETSSSIKSWLYAITYRMCIDRIRARKKTVQVEESHHEYFVEGQEADHDIVQSETVKTVDDLLSLLSYEDALLMRMYYLQENKIKDVAEATGLSEENIKSRLFRARKHLSGKISFVK